MISKTAIRASMLARRCLLPAVEQASHGRVIQKTFLELDEYAQAASIALYLAVNGEVPTDEVVNHALADGKIIYLPVIDGERVLLRQYTQFDRLKPGKFGILEPAGGDLLTDPQKIDVFVVPGVVFDLAGNRAGYGKGYYDRLLNSCCTASRLIGFCYDFQLVASIPVEPHDVRMDKVITERRVIASYC